jgi:membrane protease YdiL (CAAX protease family)
VTAPTGPLGEHPPHDPPARKPVAGVVDGIKVVLTFIAAQVAVWIGCAIPVGLLRSAGDPDASIAVLLRVFPVALPLGMVASATAVYLLGRRFSRRAGAAPPDVAFGLRPAPRQVVVRAALLGAGLAIALGALSAIVPPPDPGNMGLINRALSGGAMARIAFAITAVLVAPLVEEYVFRGVLLGMLMTRLGPASAAVLSGTVFWLLHAGEWRHYWPAAVGIATMTALVTTVRMRTGSIVAGIGAHMSYNAALTALSFLP